ncbi:hypothetical protein BAUCODRAFT_366269 [Baudoinia panamericana UAMH 10762]|uniref:HRDC domain-containing protein n=1 Tax=Baudoinia panamericana (strain UAMH 10762) TaxID=717646 RepID=M2MTD1_BAUPA|nr:uncharacterized protein BAUCODRAFT_366269 [Baudoinia panamericana UAMH 10762]EMD00152.1 hypothetical protein BAUCODRAFT_366269 [Baudoinia panamericana UAMH 10762]
MDTEAITSALLSTTRSASALASEDLAFHRSLSNSLASALDRQNARLLALSDRLLGVAAPNPSAVRSRLSDIDAAEGNWRAVVDVVDSLLERADTALDEFTGAVKRLSPGAVEQMQKVGKRQDERTKLDWRKSDIEKPQLLFENVPTNNETGPFLPLLQSKPHAMRPKEESAPGLHPYQSEILDYRWPAELYTTAEPSMYTPFEESTATFVDTEDAMYEMLEELKQAKEIAVDLEHHDLRSYVGIVCLMQISTRNKDWIVDTLKPWRRKLSCLNEVFANPSILKVLHGAYMDVIWLQRDLGLYLVGLFDTHYACRALGYAGASLAFLLKKFANVDAQKQYQTADWRIRPLPQELLDYARSDTHYLLYIFDNMRNELVQRSTFGKMDHEGDKLWDVLQKSSETALQRYEHPVYDFDLGQGTVGWYKLLARTSATLSKEQFSVFRAVHRWRDNVAREQDDSAHYIMSNHHIFSIAKSMPTTKAELLGIASTQNVRLRADELLAVITQAKDDGRDGPELMDVLNKVEPQVARKPLTKEAISHSVAAFVPRSSAATVNGESSLPLRSMTSGFWGSTLSGNSDQKRAYSAAQSVALTVPLPPLTAEIFADPADIVSQRATQPPEEPLSAADGVVDTTTDMAEDDVFVLKQLGKKRKRPTIDGMDGLAAQSDEVAIPEDEATERAREKAERKKARKEMKRAQKGAMFNESDPHSQEDGVVDDEPFDYAAAPSLLNPTPSKEAREARAGRKEINPYAKSLDTPKGLSRTQREKAGRSMTYRS